MNGLGDNDRLMTEEVEIKLSLPAAAQRAFLRQPLLRTAQRLPPRRLVNVYYDTPELALHRQGIALRTRRQGRIWLQTVKCAGALDGALAVRPEWEQPYRGRFDFAAIDAAPLRELLERHRLRADLAPVFEIVFDRLVWRIEPAPGSALLLMLDRGWIVAGDRREAISEVEIELERGEAAALFVLARTLTQALPLRPEIRSKAERGYRLREGTPLAPVKAAPILLGAGLSPLQAFRRIASACLAQLQWNALGEAEADPEFIHQMRVALRRLRSALRTFRPLLPAGFEAAVVPSMRSIALGLGEARDWDVVSGEIVAPVRRAFAADTRLAALEAAVARAREAAHRKAQETLAAAYTQFLLDFSARLYDLRDRPAADLARFARRRLQRLYRRLQALGAAARIDDPASLHALRIGLKRLRYAIEFFAPLYPQRPLRRTLRLLTELQDGLGALNDLARAGQLLGQCIDDDAALREAVALVGGWHGVRHAELCRLTLRGMRRLRTIERFWKKG